MKVDVPFGDYGLGAAFSDCGTYRYVLWRLWEPDKPYLLVVGLNPSTADAWKDDRTIRRCIGFARDWGFGGLVMANAYAWRSTEPEAMFAAAAEGADVVGPENDEILRMLPWGAGRVLVGWGGNVEGRRAEAVTRLLGRDVVCLQRNADGTPKHPLYVRKVCTAKPYRLVAA